MSVKVLGTALSRRFGTSATCHKFFTVSFIIAGGSDRVETETYLPKEFRSAFLGFRFTNPNTGETWTPASLASRAEPNVIYIAKHPFLTARMEDYSHTQISDKAFEDKACRALESYLSANLIVRRRTPDSPTRQDGWRILTGDKDVAEWEGIWEASDGRTVFLEAKHYMNLDKIPDIKSKFTRSMDFLDIDPSMAIVYVAGNHWKNVAVIREFQSTYGFGTLVCNGLDLVVQGPVPP